MIVLSALSEIIVEGAEVLIVGRELLVVGVREGRRRILIFFSTG